MKIIVDEDPRCLLILDKLQQGLRIYHSQKSNDEIAAKQKKHQEEQEFEKSSCLFFDCEWPIPPREKEPKYYSSSGLRKTDIKATKANLLLLSPRKEIENEKEYKEDLETLRRTLHQIGFHYHELSVHSRKSNIPIPRYPMFGPQKAPPFAVILYKPDPTPPSPPSPPPYTFQPAPGYMHFGPSPGFGISQGFVTNPSINPYLSNQLTPLVFDDTGPSFSQTGGFTAPLFTAPSGCFQGNKTLFGYGNQK